MWPLCQVSSLWKTLLAVLCWHLPVLENDKCCLQESGCSRTFFHQQGRKTSRAMWRRRKITVFLGKEKGMPGMVNCQLEGSWWSHRSGANRRKEENTGQRRKVINYWENASEQRQFFPTWDISDQSQGRSGAWGRGIIAACQLKPESTAS